MLFIIEALDRFKFLQGLILVQFFVIELLRGAGVRVRLLGMVLIAVLDHVRVRVLKVSILVVFFLEAFGGRRRS